MTNSTARLLADIRQRKIFNKEIFFNCPMIFKISIIDIISTLGRLNR